MTASKQMGFETYTDPESGNPKERERLSLNGITIWSGTGTTNAPTGDIINGTVGFNQDGISTANVYVYGPAGWQDTTQTVAGFFGV